MHNYTECLCSNYHLYAIEWDSLGIKYFFDENKFWEYDTINASYNFPSFHQPFYFIANVTVYASPYPIDTSIFPQKMYLDYVRVYQKSTQTINSPQKRGLESMTLENSSKARLKVYDLQGRLIANYLDITRFLKPGGNMLKGVSSTLHAGVYLVSLFDGGVTFSERLVVQN